MCFAFLNRLGVAHELDGQTDRQILRTAFSNSAVYRRAKTITVACCSCYSSKFISMPLSVLCRGYKRTKIAAMYYAQMFDHKH